MLLLVYCNYNFPVHLLEEQVNVGGSRSGISAQQRQQNGLVVSLAVSGDGTYVAAGDLNNIIHVFSLKTKKVCAPTHMLSCN